jgi:hypothetical protein
MRTDIIGLGVVLAMGGLVYGSSRITARAVEPVPVASIAASPSSREKERATRVRSRRHANRHAAIAMHVREAAARNGVPESLVAAVISVESEFNPRAVSRRGAIGLMQLMPSTAAMLGVRDAFDPRENIDAGARHLRNLIDRFSGDVTLALAAYNAGPQNVLKYNGVPPYPETRAFVARVMTRAGMLATPAVASAHTRAVASPIAAAVVTPAAGPGAAARVQLLRHTDHARASTKDASITPAEFADGRVSPSASPPSAPEWTDLSAPALPAVNFEAP